MSWGGRSCSALGADDAGLDVGVVLVQQLVVQELAPAPRSAWVMGPAGILTNPIVSLWSMGPDVPAYFAGRRKPLAAHIGNFACRKRVRDTAVICANKKALEARFSDSHLDSELIYTP